MSEDNPHARPYDCDVCRDARAISRSSRFRKEDVIPCPTCGGLSSEEYDDFRRRAWIKHHPPPGICELDLTEAELLVYRRLKSEHPRVSKLTVLTWIEGQRYEPPETPRTGQKGGGQSQGPPEIGLPRATSQAVSPFYGLSPSIPPNPPEIPPSSASEPSPSEDEPTNAPDEAGPW